MKETSVRKHRKFDETFKREAVLKLAPQRQVCGGGWGGVGDHCQLAVCLAQAGPRRRWGEGDGGQARLGGRSASSTGCLAAREPSLAGAMHHFKKNTGHSLRTVLQRYERIDAMKNEHPILVLCLYLEVSSSGYYDWQKRRVGPSPRTLADQTLAQEIGRIHTRSRKTYGSPRIEQELRKQGRCHGRNRVARLMKEKGLCGRQQRRYRVQTTNSNHDQPIAPNRLAAVPRATAPNQLWAADVTYIETQEGWLYLAAILDLYSRKIVGWAMGERNDTILVLKALAMALLHRNPPAKLLLHSDRGVQYASGDYRQALSQAGLVASMSRRGNCYDNATMESFWSTLKLELVYRQSFATRAAARTQIFDYIETFYNRHRTHSALDYHSPVDFELLNN